jgi:hypothetical protein
VICHFDRREKSLNINQLQNKISLFGRNDIARQSLEGEGWCEGVSAWNYTPSPNLSPSMGRGMLNCRIISKGESEMDIMFILLSCQIIIPYQLPDTLILQRFPTDSAPGIP